MVFDPRWLFALERDIVAAAPVVGITLDQLRVSTSYE